MSVALQIKIQLKLKKLKFIWTNLIELRLYLMIWERFRRTYMEFEKQLEIIVHRCRDGERAAFEELFEIYQPRLKYYVRRLGARLHDGLWTIVWHLFAVSKLVCWRQRGVLFILSNIKFVNGHPKWNYQLRGAMCRTIFFVAVHGFLIAPDVKSGDL